MNYFDRVLPRMHRIILAVLLTLVQNHMGIDTMSELLKKHPTWSFEIESVDSLVKRGMEATRHMDSGITEDMLRQKIERHLGPGTTNIVKKARDPKWPKIIPQSFDAREKFKECAHLISEVEDEGPCHADASILAASIATDRYCIFTNGTYKERLSSEYLVGCSEFCTRDSWVHHPFSYATKVGLPSGGVYRSKSGCIPYTHAPCQHSPQDYLGQSKIRTEKVLHKKDKLIPCYEFTTYDHECPIKCSNPKYPKSLQDDLKTFTDSYLLSSDEYAIRVEIYMHGPVVTSLNLYDDFFDYKDGIYYTSQNSKFVAYDKFVKLIGWGKENGTDYWLAVNSWSNWGQNKVFKIPRGVNYILIEDLLYAGTFDPL